MRSADLADLAGHAGHAGHADLAGRTDFTGRAVRFAGRPARFPLGMFFPGVGDRRVPRRFPGPGDILVSRIGGLVAARHRFRAVGD